MHAMSESESVTNAPAVVVAECSTSVNPTTVSMGMETVTKKTPLTMKETWQRLEACLPVRVMILRKTMTVDMATSPKFSCWMARIARTWDNRFRVDFAIYAAPDYTKLVKVSGSVAATELLDRMCDADRLVNPASWKTSLGLYHHVDHIALQHVCPVAFTKWCRTKTVNEDAIVPTEIQNAMVVPTRDMALKIPRDFQSSPLLWGRAKLVTAQSVVATKPSTSHCSAPHIVDHNTTSWLWDEVSTPQAEQPQSPEQPIEGVARHSKRRRIRSLTDTTHTHKDISHDAKDNHADSDVVHVLNGYIVNACGARVIEK
jgi:hypothetical protein